MRHQSFLRDEAAHPHQKLAAFVAAKQPLVALAPLWM